MNKGSRGFTLVEMMVALVVLSLIVAATLASLRTFANTQTTLDTVTERFSQMRQVSGFLRRTISQAMPVARRDKQSLAGGSFFMGSSTELVWISPVMVGLTRGGSYIQRLFVQEGELKYQQLPFVGPDSEPHWQDVPAYLLIDKLEYFALAFQEKAGEPWLEEWSMVSVNPTAVKVMIAADGRFWPELVIPVVPGRVR